MPLTLESWKTQWQTYTQKEKYKPAALDRSSLPAFPWRNHFVWSTDCINFQPWVSENETTDLFQQGFWGHFNPDRKTSAVSLDTSPSLEVLPQNCTSWIKFETECELRGHRRSSWFWLVNFDRNLASYVICRKPLRLSAKNFVSYSLFTKILWGGVVFCCKYR